MKSQKKRLLIFHRTIAPYRIDFFNVLNSAFETRICLQYKNLRNQKFSYKRISSQFEFEPIYMPEKSVIALCKCVKKQIKDFSPDIVLVNEYGLITLTVLMGCFFKKKYKIVVCTDDNYDMVEESNDFSIRHRLARKFMASYIDNFIVVEPRVEQWYQQNYGKGVFFPIIVDDAKAVANYERLLPLSNKIAKHHGLIGKRVLLSVSRLVDYKNLYRVIDAFEQEKNDAVLVIVGDGPESEKLREHARLIRKKIIFTGRLDGDELYAWYNVASVFILASYQEPFGAVTNEALLAGCRVIISKKAGSSCLVNKANGEIVDPMNVEEIANAIDKQMQLSTVPDLEHTRKSLQSISFQERTHNLVRQI